MFYLTKLLIRLFIKNCDDVKNPDVRSSYGNLSGLAGIFLNICLFAAKLTAGIISASVSVVADAFNNLSDAGSSVVTFLGFKLANRPADKEHPFGHGRYEYVAGLGISVVIFIVGFELAMTSFEKIFSNDGNAELGTVSVVILIASVAVKLWMYFFNRFLSKKLDSSALNATALDSLCDSIATTVVLIGMLLSQTFKINIDGWLGLAVACFIFYAGVKTFKDSLSPLLGNPPDETFVDEIKETVTQNTMIVGIHDLMVHDYGPGRCIISLHAEIPCNEDILKAHDSIDLTEKILERKFNCLATIHMDPIATDDEYTLRLKDDVCRAVEEINENFSVHDFRVVHGDTHTNVIFDLAVPFSKDLNFESIRKEIKEKFVLIDPKLIPVVHIEKTLV